METRRDSDVFVSGGGMGGLTLALALARGGLRVCVADPMPAASGVDAAFDGRVSALSYSSVRMFEALGVWPRLSVHAQPINDILASDAGLDRAPRLSRCISTIARPAGRWAASPRTGTSAMHSTKRSPKPTALSSQPPPARGP